MEKTSFVKKYSLLLSLLLSCLLGLFFIGKESFWFDEAYSVYFTKHLSELNTIIPKDFNMWLYYGLLIVWERIFGYSEMTVRSLSVIFTMGTIFFGYKIVEKIYPQAKYYILVLLPLNITVVTYSQEARSYALTMFLSLFVTYVYLKLCEKNTIIHFSLFVFLIIAMIYSHFLAIFVYVGFMVHSFFKRNYKHLISIPIILFAIVPLMIASLHIKNFSAFWSYRMTIESFIELGYGLFNGRIFILLGILTIIALKAQKLRFIKVLFIIPVVYLLSLILLYLLGKPFFVIRYLTPVVPFIIILSSIGLTYIKNTLVRNGFIFLYICLSLFLIANYYIREDKENWRDAAAYVCNHSDIPVIPYPYFGKTPLTLYTELLCPEKNVMIVDLSSAEYFPGGSWEVPAPDAIKFNKLCLNYNSILVIVRQQESKYFGKKLKATQLEDLVKSCYVIAHTIQFKGISISSFSHSNPSQALLYTL